MATDGGSFRDQFRLRQSVAPEPACCWVTVSQPHACRRLRIPSLRLASGRVKEGYGPATVPDAAKKVLIAPEA